MGMTASEQMNAMTETLLTVWALSEEAGGCFRKFDGQGQVVCIAHLLPKRLRGSLRQAIKSEMIIADDGGCCLDEAGCAFLAQYGYR